MGTKVWVGNATAVAQVSTITVTGTWYTGDTATITCGDESITFTVAATETVGAVVAGLVAAWNASTLAEMTPVTAADANPTLTLTADTAGIPFVVTTSEVVAGTVGGGEVGDPAATVASAGPNDWSTAANWDGSVVPINADIVIIENTDDNITYGLGQSAVTLDELHIKHSFTGALGLIEINANGYEEYLETYLEISSTLVFIGQGDGGGSGRIKLDVGAVQSTINIYNSGSPTDTDLKAIMWKGINAFNVVNITKGSFGAAILGGETSAIATFKIGYASESRINTDSDVLAGSGMTLADIDMQGGTVEINSNSTTIDQTNGNLTIMGTATVTTANVDGGNCYYRTNGTCTTLNLAGDGVFDCRRDMRARTITNFVIYKGATIYDPFKTITYTNGIDLTRCRIADVTLDLGHHRTWTPSAI